MKLQRSEHGQERIVQYHFTSGEFIIWKPPLVCRFLKGSFSTRPAMPKYNEVCNVNEVLKHQQTLHPLNGLSLKLLPFKVVMLLALLYGQRCQTLHSLTARDMKVYHNKVVFIVSELTKTSKPGKQCTTLEFLSYDNDPRLC